MNRKTGGFTLIGLMVVVVINHILVAIAVARFAAYAKKADNKVARIGDKLLSTHAMAGSA